MGQKIENSSAGKKSVNTFIANSTQASMPLKYIKNEDGNFVCPDCGVIKKNQN
jgi:predicted RNA-binding Zn-ribbon protein involved in translation (DUF1610 family)